MVDIFPDNGHFSPWWKSWGSFRKVSIPNSNNLLLIQDVAKTRIMLAPAGSKEASLGNISSN